MARQDFKNKFTEPINQNLDAEYYAVEGFGEIESFEDFKNLPTTEKEDLIDKDDFVMFKDQKDGAGSFNYSSGTTSHPTIVLRSQDDIEYQKEKCLKQVDLYSGENNYLVMSHTIALTGFISALRSRDILSGFSTPYNLGFSVRAIQQLDIDTLWTSPSLALKLGQMIEDRGIEHQVNTFVMIGEPVSNLARRKIEEHFGDVKIYANYGGMESGHRGYQCDNLRGTNRYHLFSDKHFYEILKFEEDQTPEEGFGELVITKLWDSSQPTVRYRTGDKGRLIEEECSCGEKLSLELKGRAVFESFKMFGLTIYKDNFERALDPVVDLIGTTYQIHIKEVEEDGKIKPSLEIHLTAAESFKSEDLQEEKFKKPISEHFKITNEKSYSDMVEEGIFGDLTVEIKEEIVDGAKSKPIVDHRTD